MRVYNNPEQTLWKQLITRPQIELGFLESSVRNILNRVKKSGDEALRELTLQFDKVQITTLQVTTEEIKTATQGLSDDLKTAIRTAAANIQKFHAAQKR